MDESKAIRVYEGETIAKIYAKYRPSYPPSVVGAILKYLKEKNIGNIQNNRFEKMIDVGCGTGQSTFIFAPNFQSIVGIDISEAQIEQAKKINENENISFQVVTDQIFPVEDNSVDLVTCANAAHWLDIKKFEDECKRVLKPNGCCAIYGPVFKGVRNQSDTSSNFVGDKETLYQFSKVVSAHERNYIAYNGNKLIYENIQNKTKQWIRDLHHDFNLTVQEIKRIASSVGDYHIFMEKEKPLIDPLDAFGRNVKRVLGKENESDETVKLVMRLEYPIILFTNC